MKRVLPVPTGDFRAVTVNVNGLTEYKLRELILMQLSDSIDFLIIVDTRTNDSKTAFLRKMAKRLLPPGSFIHATSAKSWLGTETGLRQLVGGMMILVSDRFGPRVHDHWEDPSGLGLAGSVSLTVKKYPWLVTV
jgi:hypothetical protein